MAGKTKLLADNPGDPLQRPQRRGKARSLGASHKDLDQRLLLVGIQARFATSPTGGAQGILAALESLSIPAQH